MLATETTKRSQHAFGNVAAAGVGAVAIDVAVARAIQFVNRADSGV